MNVSARFVTLLMLCLIAMSGNAQQNSRQPVEIPKRTTIVVFGDDFMSGEGVDFYQAFPATLERYLRMKGYTRLQVFNESVPGETSADGLKRMRNVIDRKPDLVLLLFGANDIARKQDVNAIYYNLLKMVKALTDKEIEVFLIGVKAPDGYDKEYAKKLNGMYRYLAKTNNVTLYPFFMEGVDGDPRLTTPDGIYPNQRGVKIIVNNIGPFVEKLLYAMSY